MVVMLMAMMVGSMVIILILPTKTKREKKHDVEELGSNAEQVVGRGFLDGSTHCRPYLLPCLDPAFHPLWSLGTTLCLPATYFPIHLIPQSLPQTYLPIFYLTS